MIRKFGEEELEIQMHRGQDSPPTPYSPVPPRKTLSLLGGRESGGDRGDGSSRLDSYYPELT